jgi:O-antigen ligase
MMSIKSQSAFDLSLSGEWQTKWTKRAIIVSVLLVAGYIVPDAIRGDRLDQGVIFLIPAIISILLLLQNSQIGFPVLIISNLLVPSVIGTGTETSISLSLVLVAALIGIWVFVKVSGKQTVISFNSPVVPPLIIMMIVSVISFGFGQFRWLPTKAVSFEAQLGGLALFIVLPGLFLVTMDRLRDINYLKASVWLLIIFGWGFIASLLVPGLRALGLQIYQRAVFDSMFWTWIAILAFTQAVFNNKLHWPLRIMSALVAASAFYITIYIRQSWTSGWFPALVGISFILLMKKPKVFLALAVLALLIVAIQPGMLNSIFLGGDNEYSLTTRLEAWKIVGRLIGLNPLFGLGPATYYNYTPLFSILGYSVRFNSHNNYVDIAAQIGLLGLAAFAWFAWKLFWLLWNHRESPSAGFPRAFMYAAIGGLIATLTAGMLGDWFLPFVYNIGLEGFRSSSFSWLFLGAGASLTYIYPPVS